MSHDAPEAGAPESVHSTIPMPSGANGAEAQLDADAPDAPAESEDESKEARRAAKEEKKRAKKAAKEAAKAAEQITRKAEKAHGASAAQEGKLSFGSSMDRDEVAAYFEAIVAGLRQGSIHFRQKDEALTLSPPERVELEVKASSKRGKERLSFEIAWRTDEPEELTIVAG
ncbi:MAG: amphi-Trp domain-containing protein [Spirochaetaceae bacterium]|nr:amphi-Trp domain-containing protein [Myxococcales bacterium]MCB9726013.1 amphi-Trp domain-containing protein [Spirochaetaceae bacterium]